MTNNLNTVLQLVYQRRDYSIKCDYTEGRRYRILTQYQGPPHPHPRYRFHCQRRCPQTVYAALATEPTFVLERQHA